MRKRIGFVLLAAVLVSGCGTRTDRGSEPTAAGPSSPAGATAVTGEQGSPSAAAVPNQQGSPVPGVSPDSAANPTAATPAGSSTPGRPATAGATGTARDAPAVSRPSETVNPAPGSGKGAPAPAPGATPANPDALPSGQPAAGRSPILVGNVSTLSGPAAAATKPPVDGAQIWVKYINAKGGINGHPVKLIAYDDSGDPARHRAQVQDAIERQKVIAFLSQSEPLTGEASVEYLNSKRIPVVGTSGGMAWSYKSPMYFPAASEGDPYMFMGLAATADQIKDKKKLGTITCVEATACDDGARLFNEGAARLGFQHVYKAKGSIAQPDYTAECLAARNAGAEIFMVVLDGNSVGRLAASCARQGYKPRYATMIAIVLERFKDDPNLPDIVASSATFPWFQTGTPASDEFQNAVATYGRNFPMGNGIAAGWVNGKLFELAAANMPEPPTTAALLAGLWGIKGQTLGGLTYPLTFVADKPPAPRGCWFNMQVKDQRWVSPDGYRLRCLDG